MAHVSVTINGRQYRMACEDGQETHLMGLAEDLDRRLEGLRSRFGEIGDMRLAVMAALNIAHELLRERQTSRASVQNAPDNAIDDGGTRRRIQAMQAAIDQTLAGQEKLF